MKKKNAGHINEQEEEKERCRVRGDVAKVFLVSIYFVLYHNIHVPINEADCTEFGFELLSLYINTSHILTQEHTVQSASYNVCKIFIYLQLLFDDFPFLF